MMDRSALLCVRYSLSAQLKLLSQLLKLFVFWPEQIPAGAHSQGSCGCCHFLVQCAARIALLCLLGLDSLLCGIKRDLSASTSGAFFSPSPALTFLLRQYKSSALTSGDWVVTFPARYSVI